MDSALNITGMGQEWAPPYLIGPGWISKAAYCAVAPAGDSTPPCITCDEKSPPHLSLFTFIAPSSPALTGQPLLLLLRRTGLCGTPAGNGSRILAASPGSSTAREHNLGHAAGYDQLLSSSASADERVAVQCTTLSQPWGTDEPHTYVLYGPTMADGLPLNFTDTQQLIMAEMTPGDPTPRFCTVGSASTSKSALVCDQPTSSSAAKFNIIPAAYPFAGLASLSTQGPCGVKSMLHPPPHDIVCARSSGTGVEEHDVGYNKAAVDVDMANQQLAGADQEEGDGGVVQPVPQVGALLQRLCGFGRWLASRLPQCWGQWLLQRLGLEDSSFRGLSTEGAPSSAFKQVTAYSTEMLAGDPMPRPSLSDADRITQWTLVLSKPGPGFVTGDTVAVTVWSPGVVGFPLQQCCPGAAPPYVVDCGVAADPMPSTCFFTLIKNEAKVKSEPIQDGDVVLLRSTSLGRYCSVTVDGTLLCISSGYSNATRMLFRITLHS